MIIAKPVIPNQYWILKQDDRKIGNIEAAGDGYQVKINNQIQKFKTIPMVRKTANIEFQPVQPKSKNNNDVIYGHQIGCRAYNVVWDVKHRLPLFTKKSKSRSWFAAGWYAVKQHRNWKVQHNPKFIVLERYPFKGPFYTQEEANDQSFS